jgi:hypothetical protein
MNSRRQLLWLQWREVVVVAGASDDDVPEGSDTDLDVVSEPPLSLEEAVSCGADELLALDVADGLPSVSEVITVETEEVPGS